MKKDTTDKNKKSRCYTFTINNYTKKDLTRFHGLAESLEKHRYICYGLEVAPSTGTKHIQGYIQLTDAQRFTFLHKYFSFTKNKKMLKFHLQIANGTAEQNKKYCKKDGDFFEFGEATTQGSRADLKEIKNSMRENPKALRKIVDKHGNNYQQLKFAESLQKYYFEPRDPKEPPIVIWIHGKTGIGKTRVVYESFDDICSVNMYRWPGTLYTQNECILFDDFREGSISFENILKITDRYPYSLEFKGGSIPLNSPYIVITSPQSIDETFYYVKEDLQQLKRRVTEINLNIINYKKIDLKNLEEQSAYELEELDF